MPQNPSFKRPTKLKLTTKDLLSYKMKGLNTKTDGMGWQCGTQKNCGAYGPNDSVGMRMRKA